MSISRISASQFAIGLGTLVCVSGCQDGAAGLAGAPGSAGAASTSANLPTHTSSTEPIAHESNTQYPVGVIADAAVAPLPLPTRAGAGGPADRARTPEGADSRGTTAIDEDADAGAPRLDANALASAPRMHYGDPGRAAWRPVPDDRVRALCRLDPALLNEVDRRLGMPWAVIRYGQLCHVHGADVAPADALSTTKMFGALVVGAVVHQTRDLPKHGRQTGPFSDMDRVDTWLDDIDYNRDASVGHVLGMVAQNDDLTLGYRKMEYDFLGDVQINSLSDMLNVAIRQDAANLGSDLDAFTRYFVLDPLGMTQSSWSDGSPDKAFAFSWTTTVLDMARVGLLMLRHGTWHGSQLVDAEWIYRMTHPAFEDANTSFGYLTWLNASTNHHTGGVPVPTGWSVNGTQPRMPGPCAPVAVYPTHPHSLSDAPDCNYGADYACDKPYDVGVWQALGIGGKVIQGPSPDRQPRCSRA